MLYKRTIYYDPFVKTIQEKLNQSRVKAARLIESERPKTHMDSTWKVELHHLPAVPGGWPHLAVDGYFGPITETAVKCLQRFLYVSDNGMMGDYTYWMMERLLNVSLSRPVLTQATIGMPTVSPQQTSAAPSAEQLFDYVVSFLQNLDSTVKSLIEDIRSGEITQQRLSARFRTFVFMQSTGAQKLKKLKSILGRAKDGQKSLPIYNTIRKQHNTIVRGMFADLQRLDIGRRIQKFLQSKGLTMNTDLKTAAGKIKLPKSTYSGVLTVWEIRHLIIDVLRVKDWGTERWVNDLRTHFGQFIEGLVLGYAAGVLANMLVGGVVALTGATIGLGWMAVIIAVVAVIICALLGWLLESADVSLGDMAIEGYEMIVTCLVPCK